MTVDGIVESGPRVFEVGERQVLIIPTSSQGARAYDATGQGLGDGDAPNVVESDESVAVIDGGSELPRLVVDQGLWFAWFGNNPSTDWWPRQ